jgi:hypothetical protein
MTTPHPEEPAEGPDDPASTGEPTDTPERTPDPGETSSEPAT